MFALPSGVRRASRATGRAPRFGRARAVAGRRTLVQIATGAALASALGAGTFNAGFGGGGRTAWYGAAWPSAPPSSQLASAATAHAAATPSTAAANVLRLIQ
jgi:hypothetical protein